MDSTKAGGWTKFGPISAEDRAVFDAALKGLLGVDYEPLMVKTQVVSGMNYEFFCNAKVVYPGADWYAVCILIYKAINQAPVITKINRCDC